MFVSSAAAAAIRPRWDDTERRTIETCVIGCRDETAPLGKAVTDTANGVSDAQCPGWLVCLSKRDASNQKTRRQRGSVSAVTGSNLSYRNAGLKIKPPFCEIPAHRPM